MTCNPLDMYLFCKTPCFLLLSYMPPPLANHTVRCEDLLLLFISILFHLLLNNTFWEWKTISTVLKSKREGIFLLNDWPGGSEGMAQNKVAEAIQKKTTPTKKMAVWLNCSPLYQGFSFWELSSSHVLEHSGMCFVQKGQAILTNLTLYQWYWIKWAP